MSEAKLSVYARLIVNFENDIKNVKSEVATDAKNLIMLSQTLSQQLSAVAEEALKEIAKSIEDEKASEINKIRKQYMDEREQKLRQIKTSAEKNLEKAISEVISALGEAFK
ncbi:MAG: hypothetical protein ASUL_01525 [Candidatus Aramenus sulfurataquae]|jgi:DNA repair photolyase|uniref:Uncharacterized protein n=2 Tax=Candidatus Aramenus sulfurataquae TaxID=1326980 RepID=W7KZQ3_9CREN|nr:MAG: hypothetical protein ASUL_01525 [Candidatus Aramenus sulfurataquae]MCL7343452.1 hypothetical protein [Candidatus Aramenus sulfurataquae]